MTPNPIAKTVPPHRRLAAPTATPTSAESSTGVGKAFNAITELAEVTAAWLERLEARMKALDSKLKEAGVKSEGYTNLVVESMESRMADLEARKANAMMFQGQFDRARAYEGGDLVVLNDKLYVAAKAIEAGGHLREGAEGWVKVFSRTTNHE